MLGMNELPNVRKHRQLEEYNSTSYMGAAFEQSWTEAPLDSIWRDRELRLANVGQKEVKYTYTNPLMGRDIQITETQPKKRLSEEEAKAQIKDAGVPLSVPETSYTQEALDIIIERKKAELLRKDQMDRAKGIVPAVGQFTAMLAAQIVDPINIAASFVPVVGPARYTAMMSRATTEGARALVRAKVGAIEGVVGAAIVEPFVYRATQREQADYTMYDSMLNIGLGSVMGAGLHSGFGAIGDLIRKGVRPDVATATAKPTGNTARVIAEANPETREAMLKSSIAQELEGKPTNVEAVAAFDNNLNVESPSTPQRDSASIQARITELEAIVSDEPIEISIPKKQTEQTFTDVDGNVIDTAMAPEIRKQPVSEMSPKELTAEIAMLDSIADQRISKVSDQGALATGENFKTQTSQEAARMLELKNELSAKGVQIRGEARERNLARRELMALRKELKLPKTTDTNQSLENTIRNDIKRGSDIEASRQADEAIAKPELDVDQELDFVNESVSNLEQITGIKAANMEEFDDAILKAEEDAKALEAAVICRLTK